MIKANCTNKLSRSEQNTKSLSVLSSVVFFNDHIKNKILCIVHMSLRQLTIKTFGRLELQSGFYRLETK